MQLVVVTVYWSQMLNDTLNQKGSILRFLGIVFSFTIILKLYKMNLLGRSGFINVPGSDLIIILRH